MQTRNPRRSWVQPLCWTAVLLDGFDLVVLGVVLPVLLADGVWGLTAGTGAAVSTIGLVGMMIGGLTIGTVTDVIGRRKTLILSVTIFSVCTLLCAFAPSALIFGALRFLAGLGLGGCLPTAISMVSEASAERGRSSSAATLVMTGYHAGAVLTSLLGLLLIPQLGWRAMFVAGALPALVLVPLMIRHLPESAAFERARAEVAAGSSTAAAGTVVRTLFQGRLLRATIAFWVSTFLGLVLVYGLNTWLPQIMRQAGYPLGDALGLLLTLNVGAVVGLLIAGRVADRVGVRKSVIGWFLGAAVFLALFSLRLPTLGLYVVVFLAGCFVFSAQVLIYAYTQHVYPPHARATGLGWTTGMGRLGGITGPLLGGWLVAAGIAYPWGFYLFAVIGLLAAVAVAVVAGRGAGRVPTERSEPARPEAERQGARREPEAAPGAQAGAGPEAVQA
ncbi:MULTISPECIES: aromatic acid/H+ symport family MFS transporter [unclassified Crossiella]|uniref:MFS transporter n=1 Tax=unclassified Crossiella TaxID=2620835 RepID=UPI0020003245|nr:MULTISPECIES: aromatic acid/H+ symport family MFS transporter [unclassified Crossiella]MCK2241922.1 aromatic acid/H+ symport family MFS transporter [Crossiella sp. S99.2]MCK2255825.1 aromatic acid/H+ symport family MFS transporter [Crossiella sp. S99.1]